MYTENLEHHEYFDPLFKCRRFGSRAPSCGVEGAKNAPENPVGSGPEYSQGFSVSAGDGGDINSIKMDMSVLGTESGPTTVSGADTLSIYLYAANSRRANGFLIGHYCNWRHSG